MGFVVVSNDVGEGTLWGRLTVWEVSKTHTATYSIPFNLRKVLQYVRTVLFNL